VKYQKGADAERPYGKSNAGGIKWRQITTSDQYVYLKFFSSTHFLSPTELQGPMQAQPRRTPFAPRCPVNTLCNLPSQSNLDDRPDFLLPAWNQRTRDNRVLRRAENTKRAEQILVRGLKPVEKATNLIRGHERLHELLVVLEIHTKVSSLPCQSSGRATRATRPRRAHLYWSMHVSSPQG